jgi:hypothetical protein
MTRTYAPAALVAVVLLVLAASPRTALINGGRTADYRGVVADLNQQAQQGDRLVVDDPAFNYARSGLFAAAHGALPVADVLVQRSPVEAGDISPQEFPAEQWSQLLNGRDRVWVLTGAGARKGPREKVAVQGRVLLREDTFVGLTLRLYGPPNAS